MIDIWDELDEARRSRIRNGEDVSKVLHRYENVANWREVGLAAIDLQQAAMEFGRSNTRVGRAYNEAWQSLAAHAPTLRDMDKSSRSQAMWLALNWEIISTWLHTLPTAERLRLNHPATIRRRYDAAHREPKPENAGGTAKRESHAEAVIRLQAEVDMLRSRAGGGLLPRASVDEVAERLREAHNAAFRKKLAKQLLDDVDADERQDRIEASAQKRKRV